MLHELKIAPQYFEDVMTGLKTFEIRKNDRDYKVGDELKLKEYIAEEDRFTGYYTLVKVTYITDYAQKDGYIVMEID